MENTQEVNQLLLMWQDMKESKALLTKVVNRPTSQVIFSKGEVGSLGAIMDTLDTNIGFISRVINDRSDIFKNTSE